MSAKTTSAASSGANGSSAQSRNHNDGSSSRAYTVDQKAAVLRVRRCGATAYYDILGLEETKTSVDENGIKKAYRKLSLLTHPDKNGYQGADEAFKMVSKAFQCLSDPDKRKRYDQFGGDPDSRFSAQQASSPFSGFAQRASNNGGGGQNYQEEMSPEELFRQFFGGGMGGGGFGGGPFGGSIFDNQPGMFFNLGGGGPGIRVHQFGGAGPRRRPATARDPNAPPPTSGEALRSMLPLLLLVLLPILSSLFTSATTASLPSFSIDHANSARSHTYSHSSGSLAVPYFVDPGEVGSYGGRDWARLDKVVEETLLGRLQAGCEREQRASQRLHQEAQGWFSVDPVKSAKAKGMKAPNCQRLSSFTGARYI